MYEIPAGEYKVPGSVFETWCQGFKVRFWSKNLAGELDWSSHRSVKMLKHTEIYDYKLSVQAVTTPCPKKIVPFFIFFSICPLCGEWCKLH
jgi:hypothetical protein